MFNEVYAYLEPLGYGYILSFNSKDHWKWEQVEIGIEPQNITIFCQV